MKLIHNYETATNYLYNIGDDIGKTVKQQVENREFTNATYKESGKKCPYPDETL